EFSSDYNVTYYISEDGPTLVQQNVALTNRETNLYATESEITIGTSNVNNVSASDGGGNLALKVSHDQDRTKIHVYFNQKVVGKGKTLNWSLRYQTNEVVTKTGLVKEVNVPRLELDPNISSYNLSLVVPRSWGKPAYIKPVYKDVLTFNKDELSQGQISIAFGQFQIFDFRLTYHLKNPRLTPILTEIALPPDTNYQKVYLKTLQPQPVNVEVDKDGNWLAKYNLKPQEGLHILATGSAQLFLAPQKEQAGFRTSQYLAPQKYWEVNSPEIQKLAAKYKTPKEIYRYVVNTLKYNYQKVQENPVRLGALAVLKQPDAAICMEFTDLFIAIARAAGFPAREVDGFAFTTNERLRPLSLKKDILHAWPEYFDGEKWIQVDPTWQNTTGGVDFFQTFDFNHFAFVIKGTDSEYPYPAGSYKLDGQDTKDVDVIPSEVEIIPQQNKINLDLAVMPQAIAGFGITGQLVITNLSPNVISDQKVSLKASGASLSSSHSSTGLIPPYGKKEIIFNLSKIPWYQKTPILLSAMVGKNTVDKVIRVKPIILLYLLPVILVLIIIGIAIVLIFKKKAKTPNDNSQELHTK
ncbi:transglutaminase domain-containing protein, partial [Candidatus Gottesmanbacteria bacterium]|nr:transglutaminase domain-containing protein [Candidatus Gottesmanbacteria bacterium]